MGAAALMATTQLPRPVTMNSLRWTQSAQFIESADVEWGSLTLALARSVTILIAAKVPV